MYYVQRYKDLPSTSYHIRVPQKCGERAGSWELGVCSVLVRTRTITGVRAARAEKEMR